MALRPNTTSVVRPHPPEVTLEQINAMLAPYFGGRGAAPVINRPAPVRPAPAMEVAHEPA